MQLRIGLPHFADQPADVRGLVHGGSEEVEIAAQRTVFLRIVGMGTGKIGLNRGDSSARREDAQPHALDGRIVRCELVGAVQLIKGTAIERVRAVDAGHTDVRSGIVGIQAFCLKIRPLRLRHLPKAELDIAHGGHHLTGIRLLGQGADSSRLSFINFFRLQQGMDQSHLRRYIPGIGLHDGLETLRPLRRTGPPGRITSAVLISALWRGGPGTSVRAQTGSHSMRTDKHSGEKTSGHLTSS